MVSGSRTISGCKVVNQMTNTDWASLTHIAIRGVPSIGGGSTCMLLLFPSGLGGVTSITLWGATGVRSAESDGAEGLQGVLVTVMFGCGVESCCSGW